MFTPKEVAQNYLNACETKAKLPFGRMFVLAILAGLFIAFAGAASGAASATLPGSAARIASGVMFPAGLAMVLVAGSELFTGNNLMIMGVLERRITLAAMVRNLIIVWIGNLVGGLIVAFIMVYGHGVSAFDGAFAAAVVNTASAKVHMSFGDALLRGVGCNFLVCIAVWMSNAAKTVGGKIAGLFFPIAAFVVSGFEHCVANMYYIPAGIFASKLYDIPAEGLNWGSCFVNNLLPVTLGNMIGGVLMVGVAGWYLYLLPDHKLSHSGKA